MNDKAIWRGTGWRMPTLRQVRIKKGVRPYGGRKVDLVADDGGEWVGVWIEPAERRYRRSEIDELV